MCVLYSNITTITIYFLTRCVCHCLSSLWYNTQETRKLSHRDNQLVHEFHDWSSCTFMKALIFLLGYLTPSLLHAPYHNGILTRSSERSCYRSPVSAIPDCLEDIVIKSPCVPGAEHAYFTGHTQHVPLQLSGDWGCAKTVSESEGARFQRVLGGGETRDRGNGWQ